ncbi:MAG: DUF1003 domain-containing protein [Bacillota bacterium]|nr:DUF1003 domain-containing protein [Bacillota bacterium]
MNPNANKNEFISKILEDVQDDLKDEEVIHLLLEKKVAYNPKKVKYTFGQKAADKLANYAGSWGFVSIFCAILIIWMCVNALLLTKPFDPFPFILLNLVLSCVAAIQAPLIMMSQNRQEQKDRMRAENDYKVNLKTEIIIEDLHNKIDQLIENQEKILKHIEVKK